MRWGSLIFVFKILPYYKATVEDGPMLTPIIGIAPISELLNFLGYQYFDGLSQLFFEEPCVKTYSGEYVFNIIEHFHSFC
jgi:hypothetical protein